MICQRSEIELRAPLQDGKLYLIEPHLKVTQHGWFFLVRIVAVYRCQEIFLSNDKRLRTQFTRCLVRDHLEEHLWDLDAADPAECSVHVPLALEIQSDHAV